MFFFSNPNWTWNLYELYYLREMDRDFDGRISYKDFEFAMEYINDDDVKNKCLRNSLEFF